jgi:hypothetical protein
MIRFELCRAKHFEYIIPTAVQSAEYQALLRRGGAEDYLTGVAFSAWVLGRCVGAAGVVPVWEGRGEAWTLFSDAPETKNHILPCIRKMRNVLDSLDYKRIDMTVKKGNGAGHALAVMLSFKMEAVLEKWSRGEDYVMYKRIK